MCHFIMVKFHDENNYSVTELEFLPIVNTHSVEIPIINTLPTYLPLNYL